MYRLDMPQDATFLRSLRQAEQYTHPVREMWTNFWLKAAAVQDDEGQWRLTYFALVGRWSEAPSAEPVWEQGDALVALSKQLAPDETWGMLDTLIDNGVLLLAPSLVAHAPDIQAPAFPIWQQPTPGWVTHTIADVHEPSTWRWLFAQGAGSWLTDIQAQERLRRRIMPDLERVDLQNYQSFINTCFGSGEQRSSDFGSEYLQYVIDLPTALLVAPGIVGIVDSITKTRQLTVACRAPFTLEQLNVTSGTRPTATRTAQRFMDSASQSGWMTGATELPLGDSKCWFTSPLLYRRLSYDLPIPRWEAQATDVLGYVYGSHKPGVGLEAWKRDLLEGDGDRFELALLNALARLGIPTLFSGQLQSDTASEIGVGQATSEETQDVPTKGAMKPRATKSLKAPKANGPATPGFDLVTLDMEQRQAAVISAKGIQGTPGEKDIEGLVNGVTIIETKLSGWRVTGIIACHASATRLLRLRQRGDIIVWGQDELVRLLQADVRGYVAAMLWPDQWSSTVDLFTPGHHRRM